MKNLGSHVARMLAVVAGVVAVLLGGVSAVAAGAEQVSVGAASGVITQGTPTVVVPVTLARGSATPMRAFSVVVSVQVPPLSLPGGKSAIREGAYLKGSPATRMTAFQVVDLTGGRYQVDGATLGAGAGNCVTDAAGTLFTIDLAAAPATTGSGAVTIESVVLRDCDNADLTGEITGGPATVLVDNAGPTLAVGEPAAGVTWRTGTVRDITWTAGDPAGVPSLDLEYSTAGAGGPFQAVAAGLGNGGAYGWTVPNVASTAARVRVTARDGYGNATVALNPGDFTISNLFTLTYTAGAGGTLSGTNPQTVVYGGDGTEVTAVADVGYAFVSWSDGVLTAARTETGVTADVSVTASFVALPVHNLDSGLYFATIQAAIDDAGTLAGHTIQVAAGTFEEQVVVNKALTITGAGCGSTIVRSPLALAPSFTTAGGTKKAIVLVTGVDAVVQDLTIDGAGRGNANTQFVGLGFYNAGGKGAYLCVGHVEDTPFSGAQHGVGVVAYSDTPGPHALELDHVAVTDFQKNGMALMGAGLVVEVHDCTVTGKGYTPVTAQNGIQLGGGAGGSITACKVTDIGYIGSGWSASGLLIDGAAGAVAVSDLKGANKLDNCQMPVYWIETNGSIDGIEVTRGADWGAIYAVNYDTEGLAGTTIGSDAAGAPAGGRGRPSQVSPFDGEAGGATASRRATAPSGTQGSAYSLTVSNSCLYGADVAGTVGIWSDSFGGGMSVIATNNLVQDWDYGLGVFYAPATLTAHENSILSNVSAGLDVTANPGQDAERNWWGHASGPAGDGPGSGDASYGAAYDPWIRSGTDLASGCGFTPPTYAIVATAGDHGGISPSGTLTAYEGDDVTYTITSDEGYHVATLTVDSSPVAPATSYTFTDVTAGHTIDVTFVINTYTLTVNTSGSGTVTKDPDQTSYDHGTTVTLTAVASPGWHFVGWSGDAAGTDNPTTVTMTGDKSVTATFARDVYTLTTAVAGNGAIALSPPGGSYEYEAVVTLTATADPGWHFVGWSGDAAGTDNPTTVTMTGDKSVTATFAINTYTITGSVTAGSGTISPPGATVYDHGSEPLYTVTWATGWQIADVKVDGVSVYPVMQIAKTYGLYRFSPPLDADHTITAEFSVRPPVPAIADLEAVQVVGGNAPGDVTGILLTWATPPPSTTVEVYRKGFGGYPEYDDAGGAVPTVSPTYPPGAGWELTAVTASGGVDLVPSRDFYYYVAYAKDWFEYWSAASSLTAGALNYHLGDVVGPPPYLTGDNSVVTADLSALGGAYGFNCGTQPEYARLDVGPTTTRYVDGRPTTDDLIGFEDLMMFAINYASVSAPQVVASEPAATGDVLVLRAPARVTEGAATARLTLRGSGALLGLSVRLTWDPAAVAPVGHAAGEWLTARGGVAFSPTPGTVDAAVFDAAGMAGEGDLATVTFRVLAAGDPKIGIAALDGRDARNRAVTVAGEAAPEAVALPAVTQLGPARPNPFRSTLTIAFSLAAAGDVSLALYSVDGRRVRTLAQGAHEPGEYDRVWDGRDDGGQAVAAGVYYVHLATPHGRFTRTVTYLK